MSKRGGGNDQRPAKRVKQLIPALTHYTFSTNPDCFKRFSWVVPRQQLFGKLKILESLQAEIATPLSKPDKFEVLSESGQGYPLNRCLRFFGVANSSKRTSVLSFAHSEGIDVFEMNSDVGLEPELHIPKLFRLAKKSQRPTIILLRKFTRVFSVDFAFENSYTEIYRRSDAVHYIVSELETLISSRAKVWVILLSDFKPMIPYDVDKYFSSTTVWNFFPVEGGDYDIFTHADRSMIMTYLINNYNPCRDKFPMSQDDLLMFCFNFAQLCTFRQMREFVRAVFTELRCSESAFTKTTLEDYLRSRKMTTISLYNPLDHVTLFLSEKLLEDYLKTRRVNSTSVYNSFEQVSAFPGDQAQ